MTILRKKKFFLVAVILLVLLVSSIGIMYWNSWNANIPVTETEVIVLPSGPIHIGTIIEIVVSAKMPWYRRFLDQIHFDPPEGLQVINDREKSLKSIGAGVWTWSAIMKLQAYDFGPFENLSATLSLSKGHGSVPNQIEFKIPKIVITPILDNDSNELVMASELSSEFLDRIRHQKHYWLYFLVALIVVIVIGFCVFKKRKNPRVLELPKPWVIAESALFDLEQKLPLDAKTVFVELTDIIRVYIESVYKIPATERTTPEFLYEMKENENELSADQGLLLTDFLTAADMVKFARLDATQIQIEDALNKAKRFVVETSEPLISSSSSDKVFIKKAVAGS